MEKQYFKQTREKCRLARLYEIILERVSYDTLKALLKEKEKRVKEEEKEERDIGFVVRNINYEV